MTEGHREAWVVVDLGFGDAGKGSVTDFLVRDRGAELVVRFNGGAQAGHNVLTPDGRHHTFSQFCSGTFASARGLLGPDFLLHPLGMAVEAEHLEAMGLPDPFALTLVCADARVITPYQQAAGRIRELLRGSAAHGSCGVGIGQCVSDSLSHPDETLRASDLSDRSVAGARLARSRERLRAELSAQGAQGLSLFDDDDLIARVISAWQHVSARLTLLSRDDAHALIAKTPRVVFEGAQGVLLDEIWGFHPHTTWSDCTPAGARALAPDRPLLTLGVSRAYMVRHGAGPMPTEGTLDEPPSELHNSDESWQGRFRVGALDGVLLRYALEVCGGVDALAVTCLDRLTAARVCDHYLDPAGEVIRRLDPGAPGDLSHRERLGISLRSVRPVCETRDVLPFVEEATGQRVWLESTGPGPGSKRWRQTN